HELVGLDRLRTFGDALYGEEDPSAVLHHGDPVRIRRDAGGHVLSLELPFVDRDDVDLARRDGELLVRVGPYRRAVVLPDSLRRREVGGARMVEDRLEITFVDPGGGP